jgi:pimeloyl-ACP methyl ester carboxylesterase
VQGAQCARVAVPLDHHDPGGPPIELALLRLPATDASRRVGSLFVNPGGPGGSGIELAQVSAAVLDAEVRAIYDVVGFDPRGVGASRGLDCGAGDDLLADPLGDQADALAAQLDYGYALATACRAEHPGTDPLAGLGTEAAARDLELLRQATGDERLHYLGFSYGSTLGALYAELFPDRVGRMVLDGANPANEPYTDWVSGQMIGFERSLERFFAACDAEPTCPVHGRAERTWDGLAAAADRGELTAAGRPLDRSVLVEATADALYLGSGHFDLLAAMLAGAEAGGHGDASALADFAARHSDISAAAYYGVVCADDPARPSAAVVRARIEQLRARAPRFADGLREVLTCSALPPAAGTMPVIDTAGELPPVLVVGTTHDPATPYDGTVALAESLGATLLTFHGDGHTVVGRGERCIDGAVADYLLHGTLPAAPRSCRPVRQVGVVLVPTATGPPAGVTVQAVADGSPAAGLLRPGDRLRTLDAMPLTSPLQLEERAQLRRPMAVELTRAGRRLTVTVPAVAPPYWRP